MIKEEFEELSGAKVSDEMYYCMIEPMYEHANIGKFAFSAMFDKEALMKMDAYIKKADSLAWADTVHNENVHEANIVSDLNHIKETMMQNGDMGCTNLNTVKHAHDKRVYDARYKVAQYFS